MTPPPVAASRQDAAPPPRPRLWPHAATLAAALLCNIAAAQTVQRAAPPTFDDAAMQRIFFRDLASAVTGPRPRLGQAMDAQVVVEKSNDEPDLGSGWGKLVTAATLEDEVKRVKLRFDGRITSPGAFNGGGYRDARVDLTILASLFAVINELPGDVRWKAEAPAARDLIARTARNAAAGSTQVFNEAKLRKADLQDLLSGVTIQAPPDVQPQNDWTMIADRVPLMQYAQELTDRLDDLSRSEEEAAANAAAIRRQGELIATLGTMIVQEGMDDADDQDYAVLATAMTQSGNAIAKAAERGDWTNIGELTGAVGQSCADCHESYR